MHRTNRIIPRIAAMVLALLLVAAHGVLLVSAADSGKCGSNLTWSYSAGTLKIEGSGNMNNFSEFEPAPWAHLKDKVTRLVLPAELKSIGNLAFYSFKKLTTVTIPDYVTYIGNSAFDSCTSLVMVDLGSRVSSIGMSAFYSCTSLSSVRIPYGVTSIGNKAFYRCESLKSISLPKELTEMGDSVFTYCSGLVFAEVNGRFKELPAWTFFGCDSLTSVLLPATVTDLQDNSFEGCTSLSTVYYSGDADNIKSSIAKDIPGFEGYGVIDDDDSVSDGYTSDLTTKEDIDENGELTVDIERQETNEVLSDDDKHISSTIVFDSSDKSGEKDKVYAYVDVTLENDEAWSSSEEYIAEFLKKLNEYYPDVDFDVNGISVTIYLKDGVTLPKTFLQSFVGRDLYITFVSADGSSWTVYCKDVDLATLSEKLNYSYDVTTADKAVMDKLGTTNSYVISFKDSAELNSEVKIKLPDSSAANSNAFLYQINDKGEHERIQAVRVDSDSVAHFYLASVDKDTKYVVGVNVPGEKTDDVIYYQDPINPNAMAIQRLEKIKYEVTGVKSSWGLSFWQVTIILVVSLVVVIIVVGVIASYVNKRKHRKNAANQKVKAG